MNKLFKLKEWLTLEETSRRLTTSFQEAVSVADCLQLALDGHIKISVLIEKSKFGIRCKEEIIGSELLYGFVEFMKETGKFSEEMIKTAENGLKSHANQKEIVQYGDVFKVSHGVYDLPMMGAERLDVLHLCSMLQGREPATLINMDGPLLHCGDGFINIIEPFDHNDIEYKTNEHGKISLFDKKNGRFINEKNHSSAFYPADGLGNVEFVFRRLNIEAFEKSQIENDQNDLNISLNGSLEIIGAIIYSIKNTPTKSKRWTQDALKAEMIENRKSLKPREIDDYFAQSNKVYKTDS